MQTNIIQKVGQIGLAVKDLDNKDKLDLPLLFNTENMAFFECNGLRLLLSLPGILVSSIPADFAVTMIRQAISNVTILMIASECWRIGAQYFMNY
ncbi:hypothetical protein [Peribacillus sp. FSL E2-0218]|uniref:hypothetical protein n=1 Tax=Peribacillus sp. FSL E2-0218 TaxID=2921364 RepID=UPI0030EE5337